MNDGFSGEGNAIFYYKGLDAKYEDLEKIILIKLPHYLKVVALDVSYLQYMQKFKTMGGIAEEFIPENIKNHHRCNAG